MPDMMKVASDFLDIVDKDDWFRGEAIGSAFEIPEAKVDKLVDAVMELLAEIHAEIINVGSEREAILEDEELRNGVEHAFSGWDHG